MHATVDSSVFSSLVGIVGPTQVCVVWVQPPPCYYGVGMPPPVRLILPHTLSLLFPSPSVANG
jgi:hypothetical protein